MYPLAGFCTLGHDFLCAYAGYYIQRKIWRIAQSIIGNVKSIIGSGIEWRGACYPYLAIDLQIHEKANGASFILVEEGIQKVITPALCHYKNIKKIVTVKSNFQYNH